nr:reverse transcriptase domain-containing protein [Tanacetum cinerariifolium]
MARSDSDLKMAKYSLSPGYIVDSDPEEDGEDLEEDPTDYPTDGGDNNDNESSDNDDDDNDVEKDEEEEEEEEEEHLASVDPSTVPIDYHACITEFAAALPSSLPPPPENSKSLKDNIREMMTTVNQGMSVEEIERVVAQRVANAIETIAIYEMKTNLARKSMSQTEQQEDKVAENASNKRKWEGNHNGSSSQQNKRHKVPRAHTTWPINERAYAGSLPLYNQCKFHHNGPCTVKCGNCKKVSHIIQNCRTPATARNQQTRTCYECGSLRHYKRGEPEQDLNNIEDEIEALKEKVVSLCLVNPKLELS